MLVVFASLAPVAAAPPSGTGGGWNALATKPGDGQTTDPTGSVTGGCIPAWAAVDSPQLSTLTIMQAVATVAPDDVWAVGYYVPTYQAPARTEILHWDGLKWSVVASPNAGPANNFLAGVTALAADDVWAVGYYLNGSVANTLILHWDGATWSQVPSPNVGAGSNALVAVTARAADDVWAVGDYGYPASQTLVLHWDGAAWTPVASPNPSPYSLLTGITALSSTNAWAVGYFDQGGHVDNSLILHWDGNSWAIVPSPNPGMRENILAGIAAVDAADIWAVGEYADGITATYTLMLHWNGTQWDKDPSTQRGGLYGAYAVAANDVWAVGRAAGTLIIHWDGARWDTAYSPNPGYPEYTLRGVDGVGGQWYLGGRGLQHDQ